MAGLADHRHAVGILGIVVVQGAPRLERVVHPVADGVAQLHLGHPAMQRQRRDDVDVVDPGLRRQIEHRLDHPLTDVGATHRRQWQRDVVERDRQLHPREEQGGEGI